MKLDDWEMRAAFAAEDWPKAIAIMESAFGISLAGRPTRMHESFTRHSEIWAYMPENGCEYAWSSQGGFSIIHEGLGVPIGEEIQIFPGAH